MNNANAQILAVAVTPDGQYAAAGASSTQALVYNVSRANMLNLKRVYRLVGHAAPVREQEVCSCSAVTSEPLHFLTASCFSTASNDSGMRLQGDVQEASTS
jgi:hypothetical protein